MFICDSKANRRRNGAGRATTAGEGTGPPPRHSLCSDNHLLCRPDGGSLAPTRTIPHPCAGPGLFRPDPVEYRQRPLVREHAEVPLEFHGRSPVAHPGLRRPLLLDMVRRACPARRSDAGTGTGRAAHLLAGPADGRLAGPIHPTGLLPQPGHAPHQPERLPRDRPGDTLRVPGRLRAGPAPLSPHDGESVFCPVM